jgi:hypothetical protein
LHIQFVAIFKALKQNLQHDFILGYSNSYTNIANLHESQELLYLEYEKD